MSLAFGQVRVERRCVYGAARRQRLAWPAFLLVRGLEAAKRLQNVRDLSGNHSLLDGHRYVSIDKGEISEARAVVLVYLHRLVLL